MSEQTTPSAGLRTGIYDLGYRSYEGARLGRGYAVFSLFTYSLRSRVWPGPVLGQQAVRNGLGVCWRLFPALVQLAVAAISPADFDVTHPENLLHRFGFVCIVLALFCAVAAPELIGRDQRHQTLALYFSRALSRTDYVTAKLAALICGACSSCCCRRS